MLTSTAGPLSWSVSRMLCASRVLCARRAPCIRARRAPPTRPVESRRRRPNPRSWLGTKVFQRMTFPETGPSGFCTCTPPSSRSARAEWWPLVVHGVSIGDDCQGATPRRCGASARGEVIGGFAGATADAFTLFERLEAKLEHIRQLTAPAVELAKDWRTDRYLRRLEVTMIVADDALPGPTGHGRCARTRSWCCRHRLRRQLRRWPRLRPSSTAALSAESRAPAPSTSPPRSACSDRHHRDIERRLQHGVCGLCIFMFFNDCLDFEIIRTAGLHRLHVARWGDPREADLDLVEDLDHPAMDQFIVLKRPGASHSAACTAPDRVALTTGSASSRAHAWHR